MQLPHVRVFAASFQCRAGLPTPRDFRRVGSGSGSPANRRSFSMIATVDW